MSGFISEREGDNATRVNSRRYVITRRMSLGRLLQPDPLWKGKAALRNNFPNCRGIFMSIYRRDSFSLTKSDLSLRVKATEYTLYVSIFIPTR